MAELIFRWVLLLLEYQNKFKLSIRFIVFLNQLSYDRSLGFDNVTIKNFLFFKTFNFYPLSGYMELVKFIEISYSIFLFTKTDSCGSVTYRGSEVWHSCDRIHYCSVQIASHIEQCSRFLPPRASYTIAFTGLGPIL